MMKDNKPTMLDVAITLWVEGVFPTLAEAYDYIERQARKVGW